MRAFAISFDALTPEAAAVFGTPSNFLPQEGKGEAFGSIGANAFESSAIFVTSIDRITGTGEAVLASPLLVAEIFCFGVVSISCSFKNSCFNFSRAAATSEILPSESCSKSFVGSSASASNEVGADGEEGTADVGVVLDGGAALGGVGSGTGVGGGTLSLSFSFSSFSFFESAAGVEGTPKLNAGFSPVAGGPKLNAGLPPVAGGTKLNADFGFSSSSIAS